jgi:hypothetical protein
MRGSGAAAMAVLSWILGRGSLDAAAIVVRRQRGFSLGRVVLGRGLGLRRHR